ncbi:MAG: lipopolysaccharide biosynthesis protein [Planctomycetota bacterium]
MGGPAGRDAGETAAVPRRVVSGTALSIVGRLWGSLCTMALLALLSRHLDGAEFGRFTFYLAAFALLDAFVDFGTGAVAVQRSAHDGWALVAVLTTARRIRAGLAALGLVFVLALALGLREPGAWWIAAAAVYPFTHVLELSAIVFKNRIALGVPVAVRAFAATARLAVAAGLWHFGVASAAPYLFATAAASALANVALHRAALPHLPKPTIPVQPERGVLRAAWPLGIAGVCQQAYFHVDNLFVRGFEGLDELGRYNAGVRLLSVLILVAQFAPGVGLPWLARRGREGDLGEATARLGQPLFALGCLGAGALLPWREPLLALLFGESFRGGAPALGWLLAGVAVIHGGAPLLTGVVAAGRTRAVLAVAAAGLAFNLAGNAVLVPLRGAEGAAIATFGTELLVALGALAALVRAGQRPLATRPWGWLAGPLGFGVAAWASSLFA